jgi:hypothetical protein
MTMTISPELIDKGWIDICFGSLSCKKLSELVKKYFPGDKENLADYRRREIISITEIALRKDNSRGYVFVGNAPDSVIENTLQRLKEDYSSKYEILGSFDDVGNNIAGFSWKKPAGEI